MGAALDYGSRWAARWSRERGWLPAAAAFSSLRGAIVLYLAALGLYSAELQYPSGNVKGELFQERVAVSLVIFGTTIIASRLLVGFIDALSRFYGDRFPSASLVANVAGIMVYIIGGLSIMQALNIAIAPILTVLGVGGLAVSLALRDTLAMLFAGIQIIAAHQMRTGDYIKIDGGYEGFVSDISWRNTTIRDLSENLIVVPNDKLASAIFTNYSVPDSRMTISAEVLVCYGEDLAKVETLALDTARWVTKELKADGAQPYVRYQQVTELGMMMVTYMTIKRFAERFAVRSMFLEHLYMRCAQEGVALVLQPFARKGG